MKIKNTEIKIIKGDIVAQHAEAIVNPANTNLRMDAGLAGFLKKEGGAEIELEASRLWPVRVGGAVSTGAGRLKAKHIIHAVTMEMGGHADESTIREATASALLCANELKVNSLVFPALGCGVGGFPSIGSAKIITQEIIKFLRKHVTSLREINFCLYDQETFETFDKTIRGYVRHLQEDLGYGPYVTVDIIIELPEGVVLIERSNPPYGWALPGGFVDYGETLEQAAIREAKEETNLDLLDLRQLHTYSDPNRDPRFHTISTVFVAHGRGSPQSGDDAQDLKIVRHEDLPTLEYAFDHKDIIKEYLMEKKFD